MTSTRLVASAEILRGGLVHMGLMLGDKTGEISYAGADRAGIALGDYPLDGAKAIGVGSFSGLIDALVWTQRRPAVMALVRLDDGRKLALYGLQSQIEDGHEYAGLRRFKTGSAVVITVTKGPRGGTRVKVEAKGS